MSIERLAQPAPRAARALLGDHLVRRTEEGLCRVRIVEVEAYAENDPASHSHGGPTPRSRVMFGPPGHWYIYRCYGIHWMVNAVCGPDGTGEAILLRAAEPVEGTKIMRRRRGRSGEDLLNGPGKLAEALDVDDGLQGEPIRPGGGMHLVERETDEAVYAGPRVGIQDARERPWRFFFDRESVSSTPLNRQAHPVR